MGKSDSANQAAGQAANAQTQLARQLVNESSPLRKDLIGDAGAFVRGARDVSGLPEFQAYKATAEGQYSRARDNIIANTPEGGGLTAALANLENQRAQGQAAFTGDLAGNEVNRAIQLATFGAAQGSQGLSNAGFIQSQRAASEAQTNAGKAQGTGAAIGGLLGGK